MWITLLNQEQLRLTRQQSCYLGWRDMLRLKPLFFLWHTGLLQIFRWFVGVVSSTSLINTIHHHKPNLVLVYLLKFKVQPTDYIVNQKPTKSSMFTLHVCIYIYMHAYKIVLICVITHAYTSFSGPFQPTQLNSFAQNPPISAGPFNNRGTIRSICVRESSGCPSFPTASEALPCVAWMDNGSSPYHVIQDQYYTDIYRLYTYIHRRTCVSYDYVSFLLAFIRPSMSIICHGTEITL